MLIFGHTGLTLGAAILLTGVLTKGGSFKTSQDKTKEPGQRSNQTPQGLSPSSYKKRARLTLLASHIDIRLLLIGSLLPDLIDKPLGMVLLADSLSSSRIYSHTLLFLIIISLAGFYLYHSRRKLWLLILSFGTLSHLIFDQMWLEPQTLLWPLYGSAFKEVDFTQWMQGIFYASYTDPSVYVPELVGLAILIWFVSVLVRQRKLYFFITSGQIDNP